MAQLHTLPTWAPRISKHLIRKFYKNDALGIYDEELIDEIGFRLKARCESFIDAVNAARGIAFCPHCKAEIPHDHDKTTLLICEACSWSLSWGEYFATFQHKQLSGAEPVVNLFTQFVESFPLAKSSQEKVFLIDRLIHGFHYFFKNNNPTRPVAVNLIKGRLKDVMNFLDEIHLDGFATPGLVEQHKDWNILIENARDWRKSQPPT